ncbi:hypothetical protein QR685DRAFT_521033 [Neurospora intermedia]|uniref:Uncharacterized protein n=1 Tax=Neurospora intermedia TaxID=5142 RepID=A0ABR3DHD5_NEUIN
MLVLAAAGVVIGIGGAAIFFPPIVATGPSGAVSTAFWVWKMVKAAKGSKMPCFTPTRESSVAGLTVLIRLCDYCPTCHCWTSWAQSHIA